MMQPQQIRDLIDSFPNESRRHHHKVIRQLAEQLLQVSLENVLLKAMVPEPVREIHILPDCAEDAA